MHDVECYRSDPERSCTNLDLHEVTEGPMEVENPRGVDPPSSHETDASDVLGTMLSYRGISSLRALNVNSHRTTCRSQHPGAELINQDSITLLLSLFARRDTPVVPVREEPWLNLAMFVKELLLSGVGIYINNFSEILPVECDKDFDD